MMTPLVPYHVLTPTPIYLSFSTKKNIYFLYPCLCLVFCDPLSLTNAFCGAMSLELSSRLVRVWDYQSLMGSRMDSKARKWAIPHSQHLPMTESSAIRDRDPGALLPPLTNCGQLVLWEFSAGNCSDTNDCNPRSFFAVVQPLWPKYILTSKQQWHLEHDLLPWGQCA